MKRVANPLFLAAVTLAMLGCPATEEDDFPAEMCEVMLAGAILDLVASTEMISAPELTVTEDHADGQVNVITGLSDADATYVAFTPEEDGELVLFADTAGVVMGLFEDGAEQTLPEGSPNDECAADIPEHWHLEDLTRGSIYTLQLGPTAAAELHLVIAHHEGEHEHDDG